ncbi:MAG TPA: DUF4339 domain-containing protein [Candidatus Acidoferrum sp.]|nr:DUF4339 domain-containing protein [Candidatus Acidoferrum sp.]
MDWFYAKDGQRTGPVSEETLKEFVCLGTVPTETLVWREGLEKWTPFTSLFPSRNSQIIPQQGQGICAVCDRRFPTDDLLRYESCFVCAECKPVFFQRLKEGVAAKPIEAWRSGKFLVTRKESRLPDRCVKCNHPAGGRTLIRKLNWYPWWLLLPALVVPVAFVLGLVLQKPQFGFWLTPIGFVMFFIFIVVASLFRRRADIDIGLCPIHWRQYHRDTTLVALVAIVSVIAFVVCINFIGQNLFGMTIAFSFLGMLIISLIFGAVRTRMVGTKRIMKDFIWLRGVSPKYLAELPEWNGQG